ncbi:hypothetical protein SADUNF_Sadunf02G0198000 [Salix dunnii]|uniref:Uncharacterized protein n=1 Tax=Salix dunnii TaxID=1413687 RepID=A0A835N8L6_9ROSI|nr:hypothetical protein SADUNF_Sadunf02G0198000 [Salix dunnii]
MLPTLPSLYLFSCSVRYSRLQESFYPFGFLYYLCILHSSSHTVWSSLELTCCFSQYCNLFFLFGCQENTLTTLSSLSVPQIYLLSLSSLLIRQFIHALQGPEIKSC